MKNRIVTRSAFVRNTTAELLENRQAEFVISTEAKDMHGTIFKKEGWDFNRYIANPIVCYQHRSDTNDPDDIIGTSEVFFEDDKLIGRITFEPADLNPKAEKIFQKVKAGTLKMASVGAIVNQARLGDDKLNEDVNTIYFTNQELIEWSIVSAGSNPEAFKRNAVVLKELREQITINTTEVNQPQEINQQRTKTVHEAQVIINKNKV